MKPVKWGKKEGRKDVLATEYGTSGLRVTNEFRSEVFRKSNLYVSRKKLRLVLKCGGFWLSVNLSGGHYHLTRDSLFLIC